MVKNHPFLESEYTSRERHHNEWLRKEGWKQGEREGGEEKKGKGMEGGRGEGGCEHLPAVLLL